jgi:cytochrome P450
MSSVVGVDREIPDRLVVDFDLYDVPGAADDIHLAYLALQKRGPEIFWTRRNGGHWVVTRTEDIKLVQTDHVRFSHEPALSIPPIYGVERNYPLQVDPPAHKAYRKPLVSAFQPRAIEALVPKIRATARELVQAFKSRNECEFVAEFAAILPIVIFLDLVALPRSDRDLLLRIARDSIRGRTIEIKAAAFQALSDYLLLWVKKRRENPGDDLISLMVNTEVDGARLSVADALTFTRTVVLGGLDTVTGVMSFIIRFFAMNSAHRRTFGERMSDSSFVRCATEELLRRHGIVNTTRVATHNFEYKGVEFRKGDMVMLPNMLVGLDDRHIKDPLDVDFDRSGPAVHAMFDFGPHTCVGAILARAEIRIFLEEWFNAIPDFSIKPGTKPLLATGMVNGVLRLELVWPAR